MPDNTCQVTPRKRTSSAAPIAEVNSFRGLPRDFTNALLVASTNQDQPAINALSSRIDNKLAAAGLSASTQAAKEFKDAAIRMVGIINMLLYAVAIIVALVGANGLFNTLAMSVLDSHCSDTSLRGIVSALTRYCPFESGLS